MEKYNVLKQTNFVCGFENLVFLIQRKMCSMNSELNFSMHLAYVNIKKPI